MVTQTPQGDGQPGCKGMELLEGMIELDEELHKKGFSTNELQKQLGLKRYEPYGDGKSSDGQRYTGKPGRAERCGDGESTPLEDIETGKRRSMCVISIQGTG